MKIIADNLDKILLNLDQIIIIFAQIQYAIVIVEEDANPGLTELHISWRTLSTNGLNFKNTTHNSPVSQNIFLKFKSSKIKSGNFPFVFE